MKLRRSSKIDKPGILSDICLFAWFGGEKVQSYACRSGLVQYMATLLKDSQRIIDFSPVVVELKLELVKALGVLARLHRENQELLRNSGSIELLVEMLDDSDEQLRKWACHTLYISLLNNALNQTVVITIPRYYAAILDCGS